MICPRFSGAKNSAGDIVPAFIRAKSSIAFQSGGVLTMLMTGILFVKAHEARTKPYRRTEMWLYLPEELRPPADHAQWVSSTVLRETYLTFAQWTSAISIAMWVIALAFRLIGF